MIQDTRKDPRAKVLSMTVRYKSATIDEFIEHHSHDVSRGGMFIKTPSPFPSGTLLKFEVRIQDEKKVMQGVGRVVWKREAASATHDQPSGMGVKFIKLDEDSKHIIDRLVSNRGDRDGAYDLGAERAGAATAAGAPAAAPLPDDKRPIPMRKGTMIGLGAVQSPDGSAPPPAGNFFPPQDVSPAKVPSPEDQTVMRQAAELLRDALREAGGSMDDAAPAACLAQVIKDAPHAETPKNAAAVATPVVPAPKSDRPAAKSERPVAKSDRPAAKSDRPAAKSDRPAAKSDRPMQSARPAPRTFDSSPPESSVPPPPKSSGSAIWMLLGVAAVGAGVFYFAHR